MTHDACPNVHWLERGQGAPLVLLHGLMGHMDHWDASLEALAPLCRVLAPELPIFDSALRDVSPAGLAREMARFMGALEAWPAVVGGNSLGGHVALELALGWPERVRGLVITGSSGLLERGFTHGVPHLPSRDYVRQRMEEVFFDPTFVTDAWVDSVQRTVTTRWGALRIVQAARAAKRANLEARVGDLRVPTLIVWGKDDRITPLEVAERFHALIPESALQFITNCGHAPMLEQPHAFNAVVREWLREHGLHRGRPLMAWRGAAR